MVTPLAPSAPAPGGGAAPPAAPPPDRPSVWHTILREPFRPRAWRDYAYLLVGAVLAWVAFSVLAMLIWLSIVLTTIGVGIVLAALTVRAARIYAAAPRALAGSLLDERVPTPRRRRRRRGILGWLRASFGDVDGWRSIAFVIVSAPVTIGGAYAVIVLWATSATAATYPVWWSLFGPENTDDAGVVRHSGVQLGQFYFDTWPRALGLSLIGIVLLFAIPWVARGFTSVDRLLVRGLLGPTRTSDRVDDLEVTRAKAVDQSAATLRRIERDLHDGTQARLVALAMHLDMARDHLANVPGPDAAGSGSGAKGGAERVGAGPTDAPPGHEDTDTGEGDDTADDTGEDTAVDPTEPLDPTLVAGAATGAPAAASPGGLPGLATAAEIARARELLERAHRDALDAIAELRDVTRSIHPPALDRGLDAALATLAARSGVPTEVDVRITRRPSPAIETIAYYCAAELLTNVAKHAGATRAAIVARGEAGVLRLQVTDDGRGGAHLADEGGLAGLAERVGTVDGHLTVSSPAGGPTIVVVELPLSAG
jgi:signal transduction histidine kinase